MLKCLSLILLLLVQNAVAEQKLKIQFPRVIYISGTVTAFEHEKQKKLKKNEIIREKVDFKTAAKSMVTIELSPNATVTAFENSEISIPGISIEDGSTERIELKSGQLRYNNESSQYRMIATPITADDYPKTDFILDYNEAVARTEILVLKGEVRLRGLENEEEIILKKGQKSGFQAVKEGGVPTFDILLKGRRVARGKLTPIENLPEKEIEKYQKKTEVKALIKKSIPPPPKRLPGQICEKPFAKLNECSWVCEGPNKSKKVCDVSISGVKCVRRICTANGEWADPFTYPSSQSNCQGQPLVAPCDY